MKLVPEIREDVLQKSIARAREHNIVLPTFAQQKDPALVPDAIKTRCRCRAVGSRPGQPVSHHLEERSRRAWRWIWRRQLDRVSVRADRSDATIVGIVGKWFPTGAHKVGAAYGCLVPRLVTGHSIRTRRKPCGRPPATTAAAAPTTAPCSPARRLRSCPKA